MNQDPHINTEMFTIEDQRDGKIWLMVRGDELPNIQSQKYVGLDLREGITREMAEEVANVLSQHVVGMTFF